MARFYAMMPLVRTDVKYWIKGVAKVATKEGSVFEY